MSVINSQPLIGASGNQGGAYNIERSLRFRSSASAHLSRTPASSSNRKTWTWSGWVKRGALSSSTFYEIFGAAASAGTVIYFYNNVFYFQLTNDAGTTIGEISTSAVFRDPSAWYHIIAVLDTTQATSTNRCKLYINGVQQSLTFTTTPSQNTDARINSSSYPHYIGGRSTLYFDGYLAEVNFVDGQALDASSFGETDTITGVWKPKRYTGTYGTNGFYLKFNTLTSTATLGNDSSGSGNNWTVNNVSLTTGATYDSMTDVPTLTSATAANYCTLNPLMIGSNVTLSAGNLTANSSSGWAWALSTIGVTSGKWYWEVTHTNGGADNLFVGIVKTTTPKAALNYDLNHANAYSYNVWGYTSFSGQKEGQGSAATYGATFQTAGDIVGVALDMDAGTLTFYKNNASQGQAFSGINVEVMPAWGGTGGSISTANMNFGQQPFAYTPPSGFVALNTFNLPTSTIVAGNKYMDATTYTGNGSTQTITNAGGFSPDLIWFKRRDAASGHALNDSVRGVTKSISSSATDSEYTSTAGTDLTAFNSNGFSLGATNVWSSYNNSGSPIVAWQWRGSDSAAVTNTAGSITSTVSANTSAGFSVVTYTGTGSNATIGHGLGVAPKMVIVKCRNTAGESWQVYHANLTSAAFRIRLNATDAQDSQPTMWNSTAPTSSVFSVGTASGTNASTQTYVAYCWAEVEGFSKFGSYTGNGSSTDGPFVYTGFRPAFVMIKRTDTTDIWLMLDNKRNAFNPEDKYLLANAADAEGTFVINDFVANGFKVRNFGTSFNANGGTYIYMAFAENPFKNSLAR